jgi:tRNA (cmo5U34)-methyltransferase
MRTGNSTPHLPEDYDVQVGRTIPYYDSLHGEAIDLVLSLRCRPKVWLDTGCGTGAMVQKARKALPDTQFILVDPSPTMLEQARTRLGEEPKVRVLGPCRTQDLPGKVDKAPDVITAVQCHHYLSREERATAVRVCYDLLAKGGVFITFENIRPLTEVGTEIGKRKWGRFQASNGKTESEVEAHLARFDKEYFPITVEQHLDLLRRSGFETVELLWYSNMQAGFYCVK